MITSLQNEATHSKDDMARYRQAIEKHKAERNEKEEEIIFLNVQLQSLREELERLQRTKGKGKGKEEASNTQLIITLKQERDAQGREIDILQSRVEEMTKQRDKQFSLRRMITRPEGGLLERKTDIREEREEQKGNEKGKGGKAKRRGDDVRQAILEDRLSSMGHPGSQVGAFAQKVIIESLKLSTVVQSALIWVCTAECKENGRKVYEMMSTARINATCPKLKKLGRIWTTNRQEITPVLHFMKENNWRLWNKSIFPSTFSNLKKKAQNIKNKKIKFWNGYYP